MLWSSYPCALYPLVPSCLLGPTAPEPLCPQAAPHAALGAKLEARKQLCLAQGPLTLPPARNGEAEALSFRLVCH